MSAGMTPIDDGSAGLSDLERQLLKSWLVEFDQSWNKARLGEWAQRLPPRGDSLRRLALVELIRVDLRRRWQLGQRATLESYLKSLPELGTPETVAPALIQAEFEVKVQFGVTVSPEEYAKRFPRQYEGLRSFLEQARDRRSAAETVSESPAAESLALPETLPAAPALSGVPVDPHLAETLPAVPTPAGAPVDPHLAETVPVAPSPSGVPVDPHLAETLPAVPTPAGAPVDPHLAETVPVAPAPRVARVEAKTLGRYRIIRRLGQGGMGSVFLAEDTQLDRKVALKVPHFGRDESPDALERFYREARAAATIEHPNLCRVYDVGAIEGTHFLTMEFIEGKPLAALLKEGKLLTQRQIAMFVRKLALTLQETHQRGVIHRDLKPANIMINRRGEPVIVDFGLARRANKAEARLTHDDTILGTPAYMPPEQIARTGQEMGPGSDIYSLGVILYELLTGRLPFQGTMTEILTRIVIDTPEPPTTYCPDLDLQLESICLKAMSRSVGDRFATMGDFAAELAGYLARTSPAPDRAAPARAPGTASSGGPDPGAGTTAKASESMLLAQHFATLATEEDSGLTLPRRPSTLVRRRRKRPYAAWAPAAIVAALLLLVGAAVYRVTTDKGGPVIKTAAPKVQRVVTPPGPRIAKLEPTTDPGAIAPTRPEGGAAGAAADRPAEPPEPPPVVTPAVKKVVTRDSFAIEGPSPVLVDADSAACLAWFDRMRAAGFRPTFVNSSDGGDGPRFTAIAVRNSEELPWETRLDPDVQAYLKTFAELKERYRPISISGHPLGDATGYASIWVGGPARTWLNYPSCGLPEYRTRLEEARSQKLTPACVSGFPQGDSYRLAVIFATAEGNPWLSREGLSGAEFQAALDEERPKGYRPISVTAYPEGGAVRFALVMARDPQPRKWEERHGMSATELRQELERRRSGDSRPTVVSSYVEDGESRYLAVWAQDVVPDGEQFTIEGSAPVLVGADTTACRAWCDRMRAAGFRPTYVSSYDGGDGPRFAAIAVRNTENFPWVVFLDSSDEVWRKTFAAQVEQRYRPICISRYALGSATGRISLWIGGPEHGWLAFSMNLKPFQTKLKEMASQGRMPIYLCGGLQKDSQHMSAIFIGAKEITWFSREEISAEQYQAVLNEGRSRGFRPTTATAYPGPSAPRFAAVMAHDPAAPAWNARHGLSSAQLRKELKDGKAKGYLPVVITGYRQDEGWRYLAIWVKPAPAE